MCACTAVVFAYNHDTILMPPSKFIVLRFIWVDTDSITQAHFHTSIYVRSTSPCFLTSQSRILVMFGSMTSTDILDCSSPNATSARNINYIWTARGKNENVPLLNVIQKHFYNHLTTKLSYKNGGLKVPFGACRLLQSIQLSSLNSLPNFTSPSLLFLISSFCKASSSINYSTRSMVLGILMINVT